MLYLKLFIKAFLEIRRLFLFIDNVFVDEDSVNAKVIGEMERILNSNCYGLLHIDAIIIPAYRLYKAKCLIFYLCCEANTKCSSKYFP
ncbi:MAG: hypothetical protein LH615_13785 [Ferruginibacter sp.]|nr:hypothetical protein [Ferruginibacter sp.]